MEFHQLTSLDGRATRTEFVKVYLALLVISLVISFVLAFSFMRLPELPGDGGDSILSLVLLFGAGALLILVLVVGVVLWWISLAVSVRRLHDMNFNGWWILTSYIPYVGLVVMLALAFLPPASNNRFGLDPRERREVAPRAA